MCYPCTHCNKCGAYSARAKFVCAACGASLELRPGVTNTIGKNMRG